MIEPLFHIYIGKAYQGPQRGRSAADAVRLYAKRVKKSHLLFRAEPAGQQPKEPAK